MARTSKFDVATVFTATDNTRAATQSAAGNIKKVGTEGEKSAGLMGMFSAKMKGLGGMLKAGGPLALGLTAVGGALIGMATEAAATSQRIDELIGKLGKLGETHGETIRLLAFRHGEEFIDSAAELARVSTPEEFAAASETGQAVDLFGSADIGVEGAKLAAAIKQGFDVSLTEATEAVGMIFQDLGGERFNEVATELLRSAETLGDSGSASINEFLGLVKAANVEISSTDAFGELLEDAGKALADPTTEFARLFRESGEDFMATLVAASDNTEALKELGESSRSQLADVVKNMATFDGAVEITGSGLLSLAKENTSFSDAIRLARGNFSSEVGGIIDGPLKGLKDIILTLSGNGHLASGEFKRLADFAMEVANLIQRVVGFVGKILEGVGWTIAQIVLGFIKVYNNTIARLPFVNRIDAFDSAQFTGDLSTTIPDTAIPPLSGDNQSLNLFSTPNTISPPEQPEQRANFDSHSLNLMREFNSQSEMTNKKLDDINDSINNNTANREDTTEKMLEAQRLAIQGAC